MCGVQPSYSRPQSRTHWTEAHSHTWVFSSAFQNWYSSSRIKNIPKDFSKGLSEPPTPWYVSLSCILCTSSSYFPSLLFKSQAVTWGKGILLILLSPNLFWSRTSGRQCYNIMLSPKCSVWKTWKRTENGMGGCGLKAGLVSCSCKEKLRELGLFSL